MEDTSSEEELGNFVEYAVVVGNGSQRPDEREQTVGYAFPKAESHGSYSTSGSLERFQKRSLCLKKYQEDQLNAVK